MIKFIYFDVGGVLIRDFNKSNKWQELVNEIGISKNKEKSFLDFWKITEPKISKGLDLEEVVPKIKKEFNAKFPENYSFLEDGFVARFEKNKTIWPLVRNLKKTYKIGLLTNQYPNMYMSLLKNGLLPDFFWDKIIDSSILHFKKPESEIYKIAEKEADYSGNEIFFIDNLQEHLDGAKLFGWQTFLYNPSNFQKSTQELEVVLTKLK